MRPWAVVLGVTLVFILQMTAQLVCTPLGEGMDSYGHWSYIAFFSHEGHPPKPGLPSMPADIVRLSENRAPASRCSDTYSRWASMNPIQKQTMRSTILVGAGPAPYIASNTQAQHPPLYYAGMSLPYRFLKRLRLDDQAFVLGFLSILIASTAFPAFYLILRRFVQPDAALLMMAFIAWFPNLMSYLGRITNDALAFPAFAWFAYFLSACERKYDERAAMKYLVLAAVALALGVMTKGYFLTAIPVFFVTTIVYLTRRDAAASWQRVVTQSFVLSGIVLFPSLLFNYLYSNHLVPMRQILRTADVPFLSKMTEMFRVNPLWFFSGLVKGFFWSGYWSFISPGVLFYIPLLAIPLLLVRRLFKPPSLISLTEVRDLGVHYGLILCFVAGLWLYAGLYRVDALSKNRLPTQGNEGWYLDALIGSIAAILIGWLTKCFSREAINRILRVALMGEIMWNLWARLTLIAFWSGLTQPTGRLRVLSPAVMFHTLRSPEAWYNWRSLPGIMEPLWLTAVLPFLLAICVSLVFCLRHRSVTD